MKTVKLLIIILLTAWMSSNVIAAYFVHEDDDTTACRIDQYVLLSSGDKIHIGNDNEILGGRVGTNEKLHLGNDNSAADWLAADDIHIGNDNDIDVVYTNKFHQGNNNSFTLAAFSGVSDIPGFITGTGSDGDVKVVKNTTVILSAGDYGKITIENNAILELEAGTYTIEKLKVHSEATLVPASNVDICDVYIYASKEVHIKNKNNINANIFGNKIHIGNENILIGLFISDGKLHIGNANLLTLGGCCWKNDVSPYDDDGDDDTTACDGNKVEICHIPPGNPANAHTICVSSNAVDAHLAHGDYLGSCDDDSSGDDDIVEICHIPQSNTSNVHTIFISSDSLAAHLAHGDYMGTCDTSLINNNEPTFEIAANPNPYSGHTTIQYTLPEDGSVLIEVYDQLGNNVQTIANGVQVAGVHSYPFSAFALGHPPGFYLLVFNFWGIQQNISETIVLLEL